MGIQGDQEEKEVEGNRVGWKTVGYVMGRKGMEVKRG